MLIDKNLAKALLFRPPHIERPEAALAPAWIGHVPFMRWVIGHHRPNVFVELGVHHGTSFFAACEAAKILGVTVKCHAVDTWQGDPHAGEYGNDIYDAFGSFNAARYADMTMVHRMAFDEAASQFEDGSVDLLHIDGLHTYEAVKHDYEMWLPKMTPGSLILFHDTQERHGDFGVWKLWEELCQQNPLNFEFKHGHGLGILGISFQTKNAFALPLKENDLEAVTTLRSLFENAGNTLTKTANLHLQLENHISRLQGNELRQGELNNELSQINAAFADERQSLLDQMLERQQLLDTNMASANREKKRLKKKNGILESELKQAKVQHQEEKAEQKILATSVASLEVALKMERKKSRSASRSKDRFQKNLKINRDELKQLNAELGANKISAARTQAALQGANSKLIETKRHNKTLIERERAARFEMQSNLLKSSRSMPVLAEPENHLEYQGFIGGREKWKMTEGDPYFFFNLSNQLRPGHYILEIESDSDLVGLSMPQLFFEYGKGFREEDSQKLWFRKNGANKWVAYFSLSLPLTKIRFDPSNKPGELVLGAMRFRRQLRSLHYAQMSAKLIRSKIRSPGDLLRVGKKVLESMREGGVKNLAADLRRVSQHLQTNTPDYARWIELYDTWTNEDLRKQRNEARKFAHLPKFSVIMPTYNTPEHLLHEVIESVLAQSYENWELCIADDASTRPYIRSILEGYAEKYPRIKIVFREKNGHISASSNSALELATGEWIALLDHDDLLAPHALHFVAEAINRFPEAKLIYSDEDKIDEKGKRTDPYFKCDWNADLFLSHNLITHLGIYEAVRLRKVGGFRPGFDGAQDYDLALRYTTGLSSEAIFHIPRILYHWRTTEGSTARGGDEKPYAMLAGERALNDHLSRNNISGAAILEGFGFYVRYDIPEPKPLVSIIIPTRNGFDLVRQCIMSIHEKTTYKSYEIILIDNGSDDPKSLNYFKSLSDRGDIKLIRDESPFNFSALNNNAAKKARGEFLLFLNNDIEVINPDWLLEMVRVQCQSGVGSVGAKLLYPDNTIQHGGVLLGLGGLAGHAHHGLDQKHPGYVGRAALMQSFSALTAACLLTRKDLFFKMGMFDDEKLTVAYNDVDYCLKLDDAGFRNVWNPKALLYHHESATRGYEDNPVKLKRFQREQQVMLDRWPSYIRHDPAYNPNLARHNGLFELAFPPFV